MRHLLPLILVATSAHAEPKVTQASLAGSGCKAAQTAVTRLEPDALVVEMPAFEAAAGGPKARGLMRSNCEAAVTISAEPGKQLAGNALTFSVDADVANGASAEVTARMHLQGAAETSSGVVAYGDGVKRNAQEETVRLEPRWGGCGKATTLVFGLGALAKGTPAATSRVAMVKAAKLALAWRDCK